MLLASGFVTPLVAFWEFGFAVVDSSFFGSIEESVGGKFRMEVFLGTGGQKGSGCLENSGNSSVSRHFSVRVEWSESGITRNYRRVRAQPDVEFQRAGVCATCLFPVATPILKATCL